MAKGIELSLKGGDKAPAFKTSTNGGTTVQLKDFKGKYVVLYFYPKDNTPGCNKEACAFRDRHGEFGEANAADLMQLLPVNFPKLGSVAATFEFRSLVPNVFGRFVNSL